MNVETSHLEIRIYGIDGSLRTFVQSDPDLVSRTLTEFDPAHLLCQDRIVVVDDDSRATFLPPLVTRVDLVTPRLSVWDFPFNLGALHELTHQEFQEELAILHPPAQNGPAEASAIYLDLETVDGRNAYLRLQVIAGLPRSRLSGIYSLFKQRRLVFGLRHCGIGILNLSNLLHFAVHPNPLRPSKGATATPQDDSPAADGVPAEIEDPWDGGKWNGHRERRRLEHIQKPKARRSADHARTARSELNTRHGNKAGTDRDE